MMQTTLKPAMHFVAAILHILLAVLCNTSWEIRAKVQYLEYIHILFCSQFCIAKPPQRGKK